MVNFPSMPRPCQTCAHPDREEIERKYREGRLGIRNLASRYDGISRSGLSRHLKEHVTSSSLVVVDHRTSATVVCVERHQEEMRYQRRESHPGPERRVAGHPTYASDEQYADHDIIRWASELALLGLSTGDSGTFAQSLAELRSQLVLLRWENAERSRLGLIEIQQKAARAREEIRFLEGLARRARLAAELQRISQLSEKREILEALAAELLHFQNLDEHDSLEGLAEKLLAQESQKVEQDLKSSQSCFMQMLRILESQLEASVSIRESVHFIRQIQEEERIGEYIRVLQDELERISCCLRRSARAW